MANITKEKVQKLGETLEKPKQTLTEKSEAVEELFKKASDLTKIDTLITAITTLNSSQMETNFELHSIKDILASLASVVVEIRGQNQFRQDAGQNQSGGQSQFEQGAPNRGDGPATDKQFNFARRLGFELPQGTTVKEASRLIDEKIAEKRAQGGSRGYGRGYGYERRF